MFYLAIYIIQNTSNTNQLLVKKSRNYNEFSYSSSRWWISFKRPSCSSCWFDIVFYLRCLYIHRNHRETKPKIESHKIEQVMPAVISNKKNHKRTSKYGGSNQCMICLEEIKDGECSRLFPKCNHEFHRTCVDASLMLRKYTCPVCRNSLEEAIFSISGDDLVWNIDWFCKLFIY